MNLVDLLIVALAVAYGVAGYRNGALAGALSFGGFIGGALLGAQLATPLGTRLAHGQAQVPVAVVCVLVIALAGQLLGVWIAGRLRSKITWHPARALDSGLGTVLSVVGVLVVSWMLAVPLASSPFPGVSREVRSSAVVHSIDAAMPGPVREVYSSLRQVIDRTGFPEVFGALQPSRILGVDPPDSALARSAAVTKARPSVVKIRGVAPSCDRASEGSGFVYAAGRVMTNAHVVAGTRQVTVYAGSRQYAARVVLYDPETDIAVLSVPGLDEPVLNFAPSAPAGGADAIVLGYPEDGPFDAQPARVRDQETARGNDIYGDRTVTRQIFAIRALVRPGNSGGPLLDPSGRVLGVVFATAVDSSDTGFVLTAKQVASDASTGRTASAAVGTQGCT